MIRASIFLLCFYFSASAYAQQPLYLDYEWAKDPGIHSMTSSDLLYPAVVVKDYRVMEFSLLATSGNSYITQHKIIHVNSNAGIEKFNKVAIPISSNQELASLQVRCVSPDGRITNFQQENLKELQNVNGYSNFKIFAVEGLELGGELEYVYTIKSNPRTYGREVIQQDVPVRDVFLAIVSPERFKWDFNVSNGAIKPKEDLMPDKTKSISLTATNIPALKQERYSAYKANLMRVDYKLESNGQRYDIMNWTELSSRMIKNLYDPKGAGKIERISRSLNLSKLGEAEKIAAVENYVKTNFSLKLGNNESYEDLKEILSSHVANERGLTKLYLSFFSVLEINSEIVFASERSEGLIDPNFPSPGQISQVLFYFPQFKKFLSPELNYLRLGVASESLSNGLFVKYGFADNMIRYMGHTIDNITPLDYTHSKLGIRVSASFQANFENIQLEQENYYQGHRAFQYRGIYAGLQKEKREEFLKTSTLSGIDNPQITKRTIEGESMNLSSDPDNYFTVKTSYTAPSLIEKAGDDVLFSVGKLIGRQNELYQESERQTDISFRSISNYIHEIVINIPEGYECSGIEKAKISSAVMQDGDAVMKFESDYAINGNQLTFKITEVYKILSLPKEKYPEFRSVVNSAADFNKVVIVFHKKM